MAVAEKIKSLNPDTKITFVGTKDRFEASAIPKAGFDIVFIDAISLKRSSLWHKMGTLLSLPKIIFQAFFKLRKLKADVVIGMGGYVSGPTLIAAWLLRKPTAICEQNAIPGLTNRILGYFVKYVFATFSANRHYFSDKKLICSGNPLRKAIEDANYSYSEQEPLRLLVLGGSLGAKRINLCLPACLEALKKQGYTLKVLHQTGQLTFQETKKLYEKYDIKVNLTPFIDNMAEALSQADLVISRAGATGISEIISVGNASILIPYPYAIDDHQTKNAQELSRNHAALLLPELELTPLRLANEIKTLVAHTNRREVMISNLKRLQQPQASLIVAKSVLNSFKDIP